MVTNNENLERRLRHIADRSGRSVQQLADDVLMDYADEVESLEGSIGENSTPNTVGDDQLVYVRRRQNRQEQR